MNTRSLLLFASSAAVAFAAVSDEVHPDWAHLSGDVTIAAGVTNLVEEADIEHVNKLTTITFASATSAIRFTGQTAYSNVTFSGSGTIIKDSDHDWTLLTRASDSFKGHWIMKGGRTSFYYDNSSSENGTLKYDLHYLEIPVRVGFRYNMSESLGFYGEVGPYFAIGVGGKHKCRIDADGSAARADEELYTYPAFKNYDYPKEGFQRWDAGISFRVGAEYEQHYNLMIGCDWGLADLYRGSYRDAAHDAGVPTRPKVKNFNFSITVGYRF